MTKLEPLSKKYVGQKFIINNDTCFTAIISLYEFFKKYYPAYAMSVFHKYHDEFSTVFFIPEFVGTMDDLKMSNTEKDKIIELETELQETLKNCGSFKIGVEDSLWYYTVVPAGEGK